MGATILIVDDEKDLVSAIEFNLEREGFRTAHAHDGAEALARAEADHPDLIILDLMLPEMTGTEVCKRLRASPATKRIPVLMLTARAEEIDRVVGFEIGADDYMTKPFSMRELILRVRAILRRVEESSGPAAAAEPGAAVVFGRLRMEPDAHRAWVDGEEIKLTALEFKLLALFLQRRGRVQTREALLNDVWGISAEVTTRTVDTHVKRLREKLGAAGAYVETLRGVGYRFRATPEEEPG